VLDQVGVNAPGKPTSTIFLPLQNSRIGTGVGGNPLSKLTLGISSPTFTFLATAGSVAAQETPTERVDRLRLAVVIAANVRPPKSPVLSDVTALGGATLPSNPPRNAQLRVGVKTPGTGGAVAMNAKEVMVLLRDV